MFVEELLNALEHGVKINDDTYANVRGYTTNEISYLDITEVSVEFELSGENANIPREDWSPPKPRDEKPIIVTIPYGETVRSNTRISYPFSSRYGVDENMEWFKKFVENDCLEKE